jgi:hypothetical protein
MRQLLLGAFLSAALSGCGAGWHREEATPATLIPPRKQVLVYHGGGVERWHAVAVTRDSIVGIHWLRPIECDSCRTALPLAQVDSIEVGDPSLGARKSMALGYGALVVISWYLCSRLCGD